MARHPDCEVYYHLITYFWTLLDLEIVQPAGTTGDSFDNVLSESKITRYKLKMVRPHDGFNGTTDLDWKIEHWIDWFNNRGLHGSNGMIPASVVGATF